MTVFNREDTYAKIAAIIADKLQIQQAQISPQSTLQDLGADSLDVLEIIMRIEEQLGVTVDDEAAEKLHTVDDVVTYVHGLRKK